MSDSRPSNARHRPPGSDRDDGAPDGGGCDAPVVELASCPDCGHLVPPPNLEMHRLRGCRNRRRPQRAASPPAASHPTAAPPPPPQNPDYRDEGSSAAAAAPRDLPVVSGRIVPQPPPQARVSAAAGPFDAAREGDGHSPSAASATAAPAPGSPWDRLSASLQTALGSCAGVAPDFAAGDREAGGSSAYPAHRRRTPQAPVVVDLAADGPSGSAAATARQPEVIEIMDCDTDDDVDRSPRAAASASSAAATATASDDDDDAGYWPCPRCTLLNPGFQAVCEACLYSRRGRSRPRRGDDACDDVRAPDATRTGRLVPTFSYDRNASYSQPSSSSSQRSSYVPSGALLGGVLGAAGALARGRPVARAALDGAVGGAMGGLAVDAVVRQEQDAAAARRMRRRQQQQQRRSQRSSSGGGGGGGGSNVPLPEAAEPVQSSQPHVRVFLTPHGVVAVSSSAGSSSSSGGRRAVAAGMQDHLALDALFHQSLLAALGGGNSPLLVGGADNADGLSYEQLLQRFGDGTDNLGASPERIDALPTATVATDRCGPGQPPAEQCSICLQDFAAGETYKTLPCWHSSFHASCIDQWLRTNAACPICKHRLE